MAQRNTRASPLFQVNESPANVSIYYPAAASKALNHVNREIECFSSQKDKKGTSTTDNPVMNPAFEVVVKSNPTV
ncbi:hypothetical protein D3C76_1590000 [compost metagenome]